MYKGPLNQLSAYFYPRQFPPIRFFSMNKVFKFIIDYVVLLLSILGSIASIISLCFYGKTVEAIVAIIVLGVLLLITILHDWWYAHKLRRREKYANLYAELNTANAQIRNITISDVQTGTNYLMTYCESISTIFTLLKGHRIGVSVKLLSDDGAGKAIVITQARDSYSNAHNRKTGSADRTEHTMEANSDFSFIYNNIDSDIEDTSFFHSANLIKESDYRNSRLNNWKVRKIPLIPDNIVRRFTWPLQYKSTIVVPIIPLNSNSPTQINLRGFLCIDSKNTHTFNIPVDKDILRGMAAELCPIIDEMIKLMTNESGSN